MIPEHSLVFDGFIVLCLMSYLVVPQLMWVWWLLLPQPRHHKKDRCGVCEGDGSTCIGCTDKNACNYDPNAKVGEMDLAHPSTALTNEGLLFVPFN